MKSLNEDLKTGQLKQIYLLYGEEAYLKKQYKDKLHYAIVPLCFKNITATSDIVPVSPP